MGAGIKLGGCLGDHEAGHELDLSMGNSKLQRSPVTNELFFGKLKF